MKKLINFLIKLSNFITYIAECLRIVQYNEQYYCFVPDKDKPTYIHTSYQSVKQEAERLLKLDDVYSVEILQIVKHLESDKIPF